MHRFVLPALTVLLLALLISPAQAAPVAQGCGLPVAVDGATVVSGDGKLNTRPIDLEGGAYTVRYSASMRGQFGGNVMIRLMPTQDDPLAAELLVNLILNRERPEASGETQVYGIRPGSYYFEVLAPGAWELSIAPQA